MNINYIVILIVIFAIINQSKINKDTFNIIVIISLLYLLLNNNNKTNIAKFEVKKKINNQYQQYDKLGAGIPKWTNGKNAYSYLDTDRWSIPEKQIPICKTEYPSIVAPYTFGTSLLQWKHAGKLLPPDSFDIEYIENQLNR